MDMNIYYKVFSHDSLGVIEIDYIEQRQIRFIDGYIRICFQDINTITLNRIKSSVFTTLYANIDGRWLYSLDINFKVVYREYVRNFDEPVISLYFKTKLEK